jgi:type IV secretory pathway VirB4 component
VPELKSNAHEDVTVFAKTTFRDTQKPFGIRQRDRRAHMYLLGKTGTGKSTLLETLLLADIRKGNGVALLDPHGDLVQRVRALIPDERSTVRLQPTRKRSPG